MTRYHTLPEVSAISRTSIPCLRREVRSGRLRATRLTPGSTCRILISETALRDWLEAGAARQLAPRK